MFPTDALPAPRYLCLRGFPAEPHFYTFSYGLQISPISLRAWVSFWRLQRATCLLMPAQCHGQQIAARGRWCVPGTGMPAHPRVLGASPGRARESTHTPACGRPQQGHGTSRTGLNVPCQWASKLALYDGKGRTRRDLMLRKKNASWGRHPVSNLMHEQGKART